MSKDTIGDRMKHKYEEVSRTRLVSRMPVIMRLDGKAFHTLTRGMARPIDWGFYRCMRETAQELCRQVGGAQLAYFQSDEISLLLIDYQTLQTQAWFDNQVQKLCSVGASIATAAFNSAFRREFDSPRVGLFDCRAFNVPADDVNNYFLWRQLDAARNSINTLAQAHFSRQELFRLNTGQVQEKLFQERQINWNDCPPAQKRGACIRRIREGDQPPVPRSNWVVDDNIPLFSQDPQYIERYVDGPFV